MLCARRWRNVVVVALPLISFAFTGCDHFLASEGNPRPPAQQSQKKSPGTPSTSGSGSATNPSHPTSPTTPTSPSSSSPSPSAPTEDLTQKSLTLLSSTDVENSESGKPFTYDGRTLQLTFPDSTTILPALISSLQRARSTYFHAIEAISITKISDTSYSKKSPAETKQDKSKASPAKRQ
jgi:hypothetical protein